MTRVLVCGGRDFNDSDFIHNELLALHSKYNFTCVIHGAARGVDYQAMVWAQLMGIKQAPFAADWHTHGKAAGPIRNKRMLDEGKPDLIVAFPGGSGTANMIAQATKANIPVIQCGSSSSSPSSSQSSS